MRLLLTILLVACVSCDGNDPAATVTTTAADVAAQPGKKPLIAPVRVTYLKEVKPPRFDPYDLEKTELSGNVLTCNVSYGGGCEGHEFELALTHLHVPTRIIDLRLGHNANGDSCEALLSEKRQFSLANAFAAFHDAANTATTTDPVTIRIYVDAGKAPAKTFQVQLPAK